MDSTNINNYILLFFLFISEILPFIKKIKANGIIQALHLFIFHNEPETVQINYGSIN